MKLSDESIERFRTAYKEAYGEEITVEEAREMASRVLLLYEKLYSPLPGEAEEITEHSPVPADDPPSFPQDDVSY